jgi:pimeloyl-ACP methyl ester carboxylesterase
MIGVTAALPESAAVGVPVVLVHGAANSARVWTYWQRELAARGHPSYAIDLRGHGESDTIDLSHTSMQDYADDVVSLMRELAEPPVLIGWSMGGLVAMLAAQQTPVRAIVGLAPSTPARERDASKPLRAGTFGPEEYGITNFDPAHEQPAMFDLDSEERALAIGSLCNESRYARDERAAGVVVESLPCPQVGITSTADTQWARSRYDGMHLPAEHFSVDGASHWGLVLNRRVLAALVSKVVAWFEAASAATGP